MFRKQIQCWISVSVLFLTVVNSVQGQPKYRVKEGNDAFQICVEEELYIDLLTTALRNQTPEMVEAMESQGQLKRLPSGTIVRVLQTYNEDDKYAYAQISVQGRSTKYFMYLQFLEPLGKGRKTDVSKEGGASTKVPQTYRVNGIFDIAWGSSMESTKKRMKAMTEARYEGAGSDAIQFRGGTYFNDTVDKWIFTFDEQGLKRILITYLNYTTSAFYDKIEKLEQQFGPSMETQINPRDGTFWQFPDGSKVKIFTASYDRNPTILISYQKTPED